MVRALTLLLSLGPLLGLACSTNASNPQPDASPRSDAPPIHTTTSATPGVAASTLTAAHNGWQRAFCLDPACHAQGHGSERSAGCAVCHGVNGAPRMKLSAAHLAPDTKRCAGCHPKKHAEARFEDPLDCAFCHKLEPGQGPCAVTREVDVAVVGAGGGGLAAAAALACAGKRVAVIEKHHKVGGYMGGFTRKGYRFEVSLHGFDGLDPAGTNRPVFEQLGILDRVKPVKRPIIYRSEYPDLSFEVPQEIEAYRAALKQRFPAEAAGIDALFKEAEWIDAVLGGLMGAPGTPTPPLEDLLRFQELSELSLAALLAKHLKDPRLVTLYTQLAGFAGAEPQNLPAAFFLVMWNSYHRHGYYYFLGGSQSLADAMAAVIREHGGELRLGTLATRIVVEGGRATRVETEDGLCYKAAHVVSNASAPATIHKLIGVEHVAREDVDTYATWKVGFSAFVVYLGVKKDYSSVFGKTHELMVTDLMDTHENFKTIDSCDVDRTAYALVNLTMIDPATAPAGKNVIELTGQLSYDCGTEWGWGLGFDEYKSYKHEMARKLIKRAERFLPGLASELEVLEVATPQTLAKFTLNPRGSIFGWDNILGQSMLKRMQTKQLKGIANLYLVGAWGFPGGGQSAVMMSGVNAATEILKAK